MVKEEKLAFSPILTDDEKEKLNRFVLDGFSTTIALKKVVGIGLRPQEQGRILRQQWELTCSRHQITVTKPVKKPAQLMKSILGDKTPSQLVQKPLVCINLRDQVGIRINARRYEITINDLKKDIVLKFWSHGYNPFLIDAALRGLIGVAGAVENFKQEESGTNPHKKGFGGIMNRMNTTSPTESQSTSRHASKGTLSRVEARANTALGTSPVKKGIGAVADMILSTKPMRRRSVSTSVVPSLTALLGNKEDNELLKSSLRQDIRDVCELKKDRDAAIARSGTPGKDAVKPNMSGSNVGTAVSVSPSMYRARTAPSGSQIGAEQSGRDLNSRRQVKYSDGSVYQGGCFALQRHGVGVMRYADGTEYRGEWKHGERSGKGAIKYSDGTVYQGIWQAGERDGLGTIRFPNGEVYHGQWHRGLRHGKGKVKGEDGRNFDSTWKYGIPVEFIELDESDRPKRRSNSVVFPPVEVATYPDKDSPVENIPSQVQRDVVREPDVPSAPYAEMKNTAMPPTWQEEIPPPPPPLNEQAESLVEEESENENDEDDDDAPPPPPPPPPVIEEPADAIVLECNNRKENLEAHDSEAKSPSQRRMSYDPLPTEPSTPVCATETPLPSSLSVPSQHKQQEAAHPRTPEDEENNASKVETPDAVVGIDVKEQQDEPVVSVAGAPAALADANDEIESRPSESLETSASATATKKERRKSERRALALAESRLVDTDAVVNKVLDDLRKGTLALRASKGSLHALKPPRLEFDESRTSTPRSPQAAAQSEPVTRVPSRGSYRPSNFSNSASEGMNGSGEGSDFGGGSQVPRPPSEDSKRGSRPNFNGRSSRQTSPERSSEAHDETPVTPLIKGEADEARTTLPSLGNDLKVEDISDALPPNQEAEEELPALDSFSTEEVNTLSKMQASFKGRMKRKAEAKKQNQSTKKDSETDPNRKEDAANDVKLPDITNMSSKGKNRVVAESVRDLRNEFGDYMSTWKAQPSPRERHEAAISRSPSVSSGRMSRHTDHHVENQE